MSVEIQLSQGLVALVDDEDAGRVLAAGKWWAKRDKNTVYASRTIRRPDGRRTSQSMHSFLTGWALTDHINGNGIDNRRSNLREATDTQNLHNQGLSKNNRSGYKGVHWRKTTRRWKAVIGVNGTQRILGEFHTREEAGRAYDDAARELYGEFARLNFPSPPGSLAHHTGGV